MEDTAMFSSEIGVPSASVGTPIAPQVANSGLKHDINQIDAKLDLVLDALGVSVQSIEGGDKIETD